MIGGLEIPIVSVVCAAVLEGNGPAPKLAVFICRGEHVDDLWGLEQKARVERSSGMIVRLK